MAKRKSVRRETLIAIAFASGVLNSQLPASCENEALVGTSLVQNLAADTQYSPELRAHSLLALANFALDAREKSDFESHLASFRINGNEARYFLGQRGESFFESWAANLYAEENFTNETGVFRPKRKSVAPPIPEKRLELANQALQRAIVCLNKTTNQFVKLNLTFVASLLCKKAGNAEGARQCKGVLEAAIKSCETSERPDEELIRSVTSILNSMAYGIAPVIIPTNDPKTDPWETQNQPPLDQYYRTQISESEKLRLQAATIADRLPASNHTRRMVHRNLIFWYQLFGKRDLAQKQREILFELVGIREDRILYPKSEGCGHLAWWGTETRFPVGCGMG